MVKSLRWRLQIWHATILTCVVIGFGSALYVQIRRATFGDIDDELLGGARVIEATLRSMPPPGFRPGPPLNPRRAVNNEPRRNEPNRAPRDFDQRPKPFEPAFQNRHDELFSLPPTMMYRRGPRDSLPYFAVFNPLGENNSSCRF